MKFTTAAAVVLAFASSFASAAPLNDEVAKRDLGDLGLIKLGHDTEVLAGSLVTVAVDLGAVVGAITNTIGGIVIQDLTLVGKKVEKETGKIINEFGVVVGYLINGVVYKVDLFTGLLIEAGVQITVDAEFKIKSAVKLAFEGLVIIDGVVKVKEEIVGKVVNGLLYAVDKTGKTIGLGLVFTVDAAGKIKTAVVVSLIGAIVDVKTGLVKIGEKVAAKIVAGVIYAVDEKLQAIGEGFIVIIDASAKITGLLKLELIGLVLTAEKTLVVKGKIIAKTFNGLLYFVTEEGKAIGAGLLVTVEATGKIIAYKTYELVGFVVKAGVIVDTLGKTVGKIVNGLAISVDISAKITIGLGAQFSVVKDVITGVAYKL